MKRRIGLFVAVLLALGLGVAWQYNANAGEAKKKPVDFAFKDLAGKTVKLSDYRGKVVVVDVWATWCGYCVREIPGLIDMQEKVEAAKEKDKQPLQILGVAYNDREKDVKAFADEHKINYPVLFGNKDGLKPLGKIYGLPTKFIIDKKGVVADTIVGAITQKDLEKKLEPYLK